MFGKNISAWLAAQRFYRESAAGLDRSANIPRDLKALEAKATKEARVYGDVAEPLFHAVIELLKIESGMGEDQQPVTLNQWTIAHPATKTPERLAMEQKKKERWGWKG